MTNSSPAFVRASSDAIIASVDPQQIVISVSGSTSSPCVAFIRRAMASRRFFAPQVMAYWFTSAATASCAARFSSSGAAKSGNPCARLMASCSIACRVISRMTDSLKRSVLSLVKRFSPPAPCAMRVKPSTASRCPDLSAAKGEEGALLESHPDVPHLFEVVDRVAAEDQEARLVPVAQLSDLPRGEDGPRVRLGPHLQKGEVVEHLQVAEGHRLRQGRRAVDVGADGDLDARVVQESQVRGLNLPRPLQLVRILHLRRGDIRRGHDDDSLAGGEGGVVRRDRAPFGMLEV